MTGWTSGHADFWGHAFLHDGTTLTDLIARALPATFDLLTRLGNWG